ncbi:MAG: homocysteine S-methyltransferase family protein [Burkholderiaceae bacterium]
MNKQVVLLDGGMGQELIRRYGAPPTPLWSTEVMQQDPNLVRQVHSDFIRAGATVITVNAYTVTPERLARDGIADQFESLQQTACQLARQARDECSRDQGRGQDIRIAGCLPPLVASYRPDDVPDNNQLRSSWRRIVEQQAPYVDLIIAETLSTVREAQIAAEVIAEYGLPGWIAMTVTDRQGDQLRSGQPLRDAARAAAIGGAQAVLVNCSWPEAVPAALAVLQASGLACGAYANGFTGIAALQKGGTVDVLQARTDIYPTAYADHGEQWLTQGASIVGGCCEIGPGHIAALAERLSARGYLAVSQLPVPQPAAQ